MTADAMDIYISDPVSCREQECKFSIEFSIYNDVRALLNTSVVVQTIYTVCSSDMMNKTFEVCNLLYF